MKPLDIRYLELQFLERVYTLHGTEFQSFVEGILAKKYEDFERVRPYGNLGDGGNDGFRRGSGIYYQVYAPINPAEKDADAVVKMREDFEKLYKNWNDISEIREFNFVFNDHFRGTNIVIDAAIADLKRDYPEVIFNLVLMGALQRLLLTVDEASLLSLHFDIDTRTANQIALSILELAMTEIDRDATESASKLLGKCKNLDFSLLDPSREIRHTILTARCHQQNEEWEKSDTILTQLVADNRDSVEALLAAADMKIAREDYDENSRLLALAEKIDGLNSQLVLSRLLRKINLHEPVEILDSDKDIFSKDARLLSSYCRLASVSLIQRNEFQKAKMILEEAISLNPDRLDSHRLLLELAAIEAGSFADTTKRKVKLEEVLQQIEEVVDNFGGQETLTIRAKVYLNRLRADIYAAIGDEYSYVTTATKILKDCQICILDINMEHILIHILSTGRIKAELLKSVCEYVRKSQRGIGSKLSKALITQLNYNHILLDVGAQFFEEIEQKEAIEFISNYKNREYDFLVDKFNEDPEFGVMFIDSIGEYSDEIGELINELKLEDYYKQKLKFHLFCESQDFESAFEIVKVLDLDSLGPFEFEEILRVANKFNAWDIEIFLLKRLLSLSEGNLRPGTKLRLFEASLRAKRYPDVIEIGTELLKSGDALEFMDEHNRTNVFNNVLFACHERGKINEKYIEQALELINEFGELCADFHSKIGFIPQILTSNDQFDEAFDSIVTAVVEAKGLSVNEYAKLFVPVCIRMGEQLNRNRFDLDKVEDEAFVFLKESDQWYRVGDKSPLDAIAIKTDSPKYGEFIGSEIGSHVNVSGQFGLEAVTETVAKILTEAGYVFEKIRESFRKLSEKDLVPHVWALEIKEKDGEIDSQHLIETIKKVTGTNDALLKTYQNGNIPLAFLATNQGSLGHGLGRIVNEEKGYVNFSSGTLEDFNSQVSLAKKILSDDSRIYIDGTSALFLVEFGFFDKVMGLLTNVKVPQSVVNLLENLAEAAAESFGSVGRLLIKKDGLVIHEPDHENLQKTRNSFIAAIQLCEEKDNCIELLSPAYKDEFIENQLLSELVDASVLARRDKAVVLTDDYLYLSFAEHSLGYAKLPFFSSVALVRALYLLGHVSFKEYIGYFAYASGYRFRFLPIIPLDVVKAVLGDELVKEVNARSIENFNFKLTLSQEYGVSEEECIRVLSAIHLNFILDSSISLEIFERIVIEIIASLPDSLNKVTVINGIQSRCEASMRQMQQSNTPYLDHKRTRSKISRLNTVKSIYA